MRSHSAGKVSSYPLISDPLPKFLPPDDVRSANMQAIRSKGNRSTEVRLRLMLVRSGISGWRMHPKNIPGTPDFFFPQHEVAVFIDGCYWHGCPKCGHIPKTNMEYWTAKIGRNKKRDRKYSRELKKQGYKVIRIWECILKRDPARCLQRISAAVRENDN